MNPNLVEDVFKRRVASSLVVLGIRRIVLQSVLTFSNILLARILTPEIFGSFAIITFLIMTIGTITNLGLGPAIVQKKETVSKYELRSIFTYLLVASVVFIACIYFLAPVINVLYRGNLKPEGVFWLRLFSLTLILSNAVSISLRLLERNLEYMKLTVGEIITSFITQIIILILAVKGFGIGSFVIGSLIGGVISLILFFFLSPWSIGFNFSLTPLRKYFEFSSNYQANSIIGIVNGAVVPIFVGAVSGSYAVGLIMWAGGIRQAGLAPFEVIQKLIFPVASRLQENKSLLTSLIEKMLVLSCLFSLPILAITFSLAPSFITIIYTQKWLLGLTALYISLIQGVFVLLGTIFIDVLLALGKAKTVRNISLLWAVLQWLLTVPLVLIWNFNGAVLAGFLVSTTFFIPLAKLRREMKLDVWSNVVPYLNYAVLSAVCTFMLSRVIIIDSVAKLFVVGLAGMLVYFAIVFLRQKTSLVRNISIFKKLIWQQKCTPILESSR